jgi:hypothetical protein
LLKIISTYNKDIVRQLKSFTALALSNIAVADVNEKIEYCNMHPFRSGGCSDLNTVYYQAHSSLTDAKKKAKSLIELGLKLEPGDEHLKLLLGQLSI